MSEYGDLVKAKCDAFADRVVKLNDYLLQLESKKEEVRSKMEKRRAIPIFLLSVANICNQLLRAGTSIGANKGSGGQELSYTLGTQYIDLWSSSSLQGIAQTSLDSAPASFVTSLKQIA